MKFTKQGKIKLTKADYRVGNFIFTMESDYVKVQDVSMCAPFRVARHIPAGMMLELAIRQARDGEEQSKTFLHAYASVMWNVHCTCPVVNHDEDGNVTHDFLAALNDAAIKCVNLNKQLYGIKDDISDEKNEEILNEVKEYTEEMEQLKSDLESKE